MLTYAVFYALFINFDFNNHNSLTVSKFNENFGQSY